MIHGTLVLVSAGFITRILGFVFRIYLSELMGSEGMGLYQLITPIYFLAFAMCASGTQLAISRLASHDHTKSRSILYAGMLLSVSMGLVITVLLYVYADWFSGHILNESRLSGPLRILSLALPWSIASGCIKSYFHARQRMDVPAIDQLIEQLCRMGAIYLLAPALGNGNIIDICYMAVWGNVAGDFLSCIYCIIAYLKDLRKYPSPVKASSLRAHMPSLLAILIPLSANRVISQLLSSFENVLLPMSLQESGLSSSQSLSIYGEFSGMAMPILFFPCIITNAVSTNMLPVVARADAAGNHKLIRSSIHHCVHYTLLIGFLFTVILFTCGHTLGQLLYHNIQVGRFITWLSLLCPFFYLESTFGGLMNGLGLHNRSFIHSILSDVLRIAVVMLLVPKYGISAFYAGMSLSLILCTLLNLRSLCKISGLLFQPLRELLIPALSATLSIVLVHRLSLTAPPVPQLLLKAGLAFIVYAAIQLWADSDLRKLIKGKPFL